MDRIAFFDRWAPSYDTLLPSVFYQAVHRRLLESCELPSQGAVLDVGCGTGKLLNRIADRYPTLSGIGVDLSAGMIRQAQRSTPHGDRLQFIYGDVTNLPLAPGTVERAFCSISFLHYPDPVAALRAIAAVLSPAGQFYLADFAPPRWDPSPPGQSLFSPGAVRFYSADTRAALGHQAGLQCDRHVYLLGPVMMTQFSVR